MTSSGALGTEKISVDPVRTIRGRHHRKTASSLDWTRSSFSRYRDPLSLTNLIPRTSQQPEVTRRSQNLFCHLPPLPLQARLRSLSPYQIAMSGRNISYGRGGAGRYFRVLASIGMRPDLALSRQHLPSAVRHHAEGSCHPNNQARSLYHRSRRLREHGSE